MDAHLPIAAPVPRSPLAVSRCLGLCAIFATCGVGNATKAQGVLRLNFEGPEISWRSAGGDAQHTYALHQRVPGAAQSGQACEHVRINAGNGTCVYLRHDIGAARIIDELRPSVWIKANRPGLQLLVRAVLPRTLDANKQPATLYLRGTSYTQSNAWQQLTIEQLSRQLERETVWLRTRIGPNVDPREAYLDAVILNVYGGPGATQVWIDDLEVSGFVGREPTAGPSASLARWSPPSQPAASPTPATVPKVEMNGSLLMAGGHPVFVRAIQYQGEPLEFLKGLGFNTLHLARFPAPPLLAEAERVGLWLICPPPADPTRDTRDVAGPARILCWDLGEQLSGVELSEVKQQAERLKSLDSTWLRPLTAEAETDLRSYSRSFDLLRASRPALASSLELVDYHTWLRERPRLARPGTTLWTMLQTEPPEALVEQLRLSPGRPVQAQVCSEQIRLAAYSAIAAGVRGLIFASRARLDEKDAATQQRALTLELLNLELDLVAPFCSAGSLVGMVQGSEPEVRAAVLQADRARLLVPFWAGRYSQYVPGQAAGNDIVFTVPGIPEACDAYEVTPGGVRALKNSRKAMGLRLTLDEFGLASAVLLTYDPLSITSLSKRVQQSQRKAAELQRQLVTLRLAEVEVIDRQLPPLTTAADAVAWIKLSRSHLQQCETRLAAGQQHNGEAFQHAARALRPLRMVERAHWEQAHKAIGSPMSLPAAACYSTLPQFWSLLNTIKGSQMGLNVLPAGDCENLNRLVASGWQHFEHKQEGLVTDVQLVPNDPHAGQSCLRLRAWQPETGAEGNLIETAPVWITSAPVQVEAGQLVRIRGWIHVPKPVTGSVDGLMIIDSLAGPALAERIGQTQGWQEFSLYRMASQSGAVTVTFALTGLGVARIDDVSIEPVLLPNAQQARVPPR